SSRTERLPGEIDADGNLAMNTNPTGWGLRYDESRGRGRRASSLVPGNGGAPAPALARRPIHGGPVGAARRARRDAWAYSLDAAHLQSDLQVPRVWAHRTWRRSPRQCSRHDIGTGSLQRDRARTIASA